jgi:hypothetical protein
MISFFNGRTRSLGGQSTAVFAKVDVAFRDYLHLLKGAHLGVFLAIALHCNEEGWAWPSYATLARETGYSEDTIRRALAHLCQLEIEGHRVLLRYQPKTDEGTFQSNRYLLFPSAEEVARYEGRGVSHLGAETGGGFDDRGGKTPPRSPWWEKPTSENPTTKKNHDKPEKKQKKQDDPSPVDAPVPCKETIAATWHAATSQELGADGLDALVHLVGPGPEQTDLNSLLATIIELERRVVQMTPDLVEAVVTGQTAMPPLGPDPPPVLAPPEIPVITQPSMPDDDPVLAQVMHWYVAEISRRITPMMADDLRDLIKTQRALDVWEFAFVASRNIGSPVSRWRYVTKVVTEPDMEAVEAWIASGKKRIPAKQNTKRPRASDGAARGRGQVSAIMRKPSADPVDPEQVARDRALLMEHRRRREEQKNAEAATDG